LCQPSDETAEIAMTQAELEIEFGSLRDRVSQMEQQQEDHKKKWFRWGHITAFIAIAMAIVSTILLHLGSPRNDRVFAAMMLWVLLSILFNSAGQPPGLLSFWSRLKWGWSGQGKNAQLSDFVFSVIAILLLLDAFTLFQPV
jgi:hypothetical protein